MSEQIEKATLQRTVNERFKTYAEAKVRAEALVATGQYAKVRVRRRPTASRFDVLGFTPVKK
jgi:hypothetical protein